MLGNGFGAFGSCSTFTVGDHPCAVAVSDLDGDEDPDLVVANWSDNSVSVLMGTGGGNFSNHTDYAVGEGPSSVVVEDLNGDGDPDLAVANQESDDVSIMLGNGSGSFTCLATFPAGNGPSGIAVADINGDSIPDLAVSDSVGDDVSVLIGEGDGTFSPGGSYGAGNSPSSVAIADLNCDGIQDLATANCLSTTISVLLGYGDGSFAPCTNYGYGAGDGPRPIAVEDLNADGAPDVAVANGYSYTVSVLLNRSTPPTGVEDGPDVYVSGSALLQNVPNPFNPVTTISFIVPANTVDAEIGIYNVSGRLVRRWDWQNPDEGLNSIVWDGRDESGRQTGSGVYFYRLVMDGLVESKKMTLLK
jgi:hypothetical protein